MYVCCSDEKLTLIFYKRIRLELIVYLLRFYVFFVIPDLLATYREENSAVAIRRFYFERNFSHFQSCFTHFIIVISFVGNSVLVSIYSVEFLQFLLATYLYWIHSKFYLFVCLCSVLVVFDVVGKKQYLGLYFCV